MEILFHPRSRVTFGAEFFRAAFSTTDAYAVSQRDSFQYLDAKNQLVTYQSPGTVFAAFNLRQASPIPYGSLFNVYVNLLPSTAKVQVFVGGGGGVAQTEGSYTYQTYVDAIYERLAGFRYDLPNYKRTGIAPAYKGVGGITAHINTHIAIRAEAGWRNGGYAAIGIAIQ